MRVLPDMLSTACGVDVDLAHRIGADVLTRAEALATLSTREQDVLIAPFVEEVFDHKPVDASLETRAKVTVVVRNSLLEQAHHHGPLTSGIITATEYAAGRSPTFSPPDGANLSTTTARTPSPDWPRGTHEPGPAWTP